MLLPMFESRCMHFTIFLPMKVNQGTSDYYNDHITNKKLLKIHVDFFVLHGSLLISFGVTQIVDQFCYREV